MKFTIRTNYLIFPVYTHATEKKLMLSQGENTLLELDIRLDCVSPDFWTYADVSFLRNETVDISVSPEIPLSFGEADEIHIDNLYREAMRPQVHFTLKNGALGEPLALVAANGAYRLLYRCNPADTRDGNQCWGYAESPDLIHWTEKNTSIFPDDIMPLLSRRAVAAWKSLREIRLQGEAERTDLFPLSLGDGKRKWVRMNADGTYRIGDLADGVFHPTQEVKRLLYGAPSAGAILADRESGKAIRMERKAWSAANFRFCGQMSFPAALTLETDTEGYVLSMSPIDKAEALYKNTNRYENLRIDSKKVVEIPLADAAHLIRMRGAFDPNAKISAVLFGRELHLDFSENLLRVGSESMPIAIGRDVLDLTLIVDRLSVEIFADGGKLCAAFASEDVFCDRNLLSLILQSESKYDFDLLEIHSLETIW